MENTLIISRFLLSLCYSLTLFSTIFGIALNKDVFVNLSEFGKIKLFKKYFKAMAYIFYRPVNFYRSMLMLVMTIFFTAAWSNNWNSVGPIWLLGGFIFLVYYHYKQYEELTLYFKIKNL